MTYLLCTVLVVCGLIVAAIAWEDFQIKQDEHEYWWR